MKKEILTTKQMALYITRYHKRSGVIMTVSGDNAAVLYENETSLTGIIRTIRNGYICYMRYIAKTKKDRIRLMSMFLVLDVKAEQEKTIRI